MRQRVCTRVGIGAVMTCLVLAAGSIGVYARAIELGNDVDVGWGNFRCNPPLFWFACPPLTGENRYPELTRVETTRSLGLFQPQERRDWSVVISNYTFSKIDSYELTLYVGAYTQPEWDAKGNDSYSVVAELTTDIQFLNDIEPQTEIGPDLFSATNNGTKISFDDVMSTLSGPLVFVISGRVRGNVNFGCPGFNLDPNTDECPLGDGPEQRPDPISARVTLVGGAEIKPSPIKALYVTELRSRIGALRTRFGLQPYNWTEPSLVAGMTIKAVHVTELREALGQAYSAANRTLAPFTDPVIVQRSTIIKGVHIRELRVAVVGLETT